MPDRSVWRKRVGVCVASAGLLVSTVWCSPAGAEVMPDPALYQCRPIPNDIAKPPPLPPEAARLRAMSPPPPKLCADGEVAYPESIPGEKMVPPGDPQGRVAVPRAGLAQAASGHEVVVRALRSRPSRKSARRWFHPRARMMRRIARASTTPGYGAHYAWSVLSQGYAGSGVDGWWGWQTQHAPFFNVADGGHSLAQMWVIDGTYGHPGSTVEFGWRESVNHYGDTRPHLFIYHFDNNVGGGYYTEFVPQPGSPLINRAVSWDDGLHQYGIQRFGDNWWVYHDGYWLGYLPRAAWSHPLSFVSRTEAGGEVAATLTPTPCYWMGNGQWGTSSASAYWQNLYFSYGGSTFYPQWGSTYATDPAAYNVGFANLATGSFHYGGPGFVGGC